MIQYLTMYVLVFYYVQYYTTEHTVQEFIYRKRKHTGETKADWTNMLDF